MNAVTYFRQEHGAWTMLIFVALAFVGVGIGVVSPSLGGGTWRNVIWTGCFLGILLGALNIGNRSRQVLTTGQRCLVRLLGFAFYFVAMFIGGGLGLLLLK